MIYEQNLVKIGELDPSVQSAALLWMDECWNCNRMFRILEAYRTQDRQNQLYAQGRTKPGIIVTYTLHSLHTKRLAVDIEPIGTNFDAIAEIARKYDISHPFAFDLAHFQLDTVLANEPFPKGDNLTPEARIKGLERRLANTKNPDSIKLISGILARLRKRLSSPPSQ